MKYFSVFLIIGLTVLFHPLTAAAFPKEHFIIHPVEPIPEAAITQEELEAWSNASENFAQSEEALWDAYENALDDFGSGGESWLKMNQGDWAKLRQADAFARYAPKGSSAYLDFLIQEAGKRVAWLEQLGEKGQVVFAHNYLYQQAGFDGMLILYYRSQEIEVELYTKNLKTGAICETSGKGTLNESKVPYENFTLEFIDLGKSLELSASAQAALCQDSGKFTGTYMLTK